MVEQIHLRSDYRYWDRDRGCCACSACSVFGMLCTFFSVCFTGVEVEEGGKEEEELDWEYERISIMLVRVLKRVVVVVRGVGGSLS